MMFNIFLRIIILLSLLNIASSCSKDKTYDKKIAVSAFVFDDPLQISSKKIDTQIEIQKPIDSWNYGKNFHQNGRVGNLKKDFSYNKGKILLKKDSKIYTDFNLFGNSGKIFSPVIYNNRGYFLDNSGLLEAFDLRSEKKLWQTRLYKPDFLTYFDNPKIFASEDKIFASIGNNEIKAININNGKLIWSVKLPSLLISKPVVWGDKLFILADNNKLYTLNSNDGKVIWSHSGILSNMAIYGAADPLISADKVFVSYSSGEIYALNKKDGSEIWSYDLNVNKAVGSNFFLNDIDATPIMRSGRLYVVGNGGLMMAINIQNGDVIWKKRLSSIIDFHLSGNFIYVINNDNKLVALSIGDGSIKWIKELPDFKNPKKPQTKIIYNSVIMAGGLLMVNSVDGELFILSPKTGKLLQNIDIGGKNFHSPIVIDDKIYFYKQGLMTRYLVSYK